MFWAVIGSARVTAVVVDIVRQGARGSGEYMWQGNASSCKINKASSCFFCRETSHFYWPTPAGAEANPARQIPKAVPKLFLTKFIAVSTTGTNFDNSDALFQTQ
jgi:hypothetical protein